MEFFSEREPLRKWLYGILLVLVAGMVIYGFVSDEESSFWLALAAAILLPVGIEGARKETVPHDEVVAFDDGKQVVAGPAAGSLIEGAPVTPDNAPHLVIE